MGALWGAQGRPRVLWSTVATAQPGFTRTRTCDEADTGTGTHAGTGTCSGGVALLLDDEEGVAPCRATAAPPSAIAD